MAVVSLAMCVLATGEHVDFLDEFTGTDGSVPNPTNWSVETGGRPHVVEIKNNTLRTKVNGYGFARALSNVPFTMNNFSVIVEFNSKSIEGRSVEITLFTWTESTYDRWLTLEYDSSRYGWAVTYVHESRINEYQSSKFGIQRETWYSINITVHLDQFNITVTDKETGTGMMAMNMVDMDPLMHRNLMSIGVSSSGGYDVPHTYWDNLMLVDRNRPPNCPPVWTALPVLHAVEDIVLVYDFSPNVSDPDGPKRYLRLSADPEYIVRIRGLEVEFQFPNGITSAKIRFDLTDLLAVAVKYVYFVIAPINDPPLEYVPPRHEAYEDLPFILDFRTLVWDEDNESSELFLKVADQYASAEGLILTVVFPEGILEYELWLYLSDGENDVLIQLLFTVRPTDDPPTIAPLGELTVKEDEPVIFNLTTYIQDPDTPMEELGVMTREVNCTVIGLELHFLFHRGGFDVEVDVEVADGHSRVGATLLVHVIEVDDAPVVAAILPHLLVEDEVKSFDLSPYISDEDTPPDQLTVECDHHGVLNVSGFLLVFLYNTWEPEHEVVFTVSDGTSLVNSSILIQVQSVNDPPVVRGFEDLVPAGTISLEEATDLWLEFQVEDEDDTYFEFSVESGWEGITVHDNASLHISAPHGNVGQFWFELTVDDRNGGVVTFELRVQVLNVNDPPELPSILEPINNTKVDRGTSVDFWVQVDDPDLVYGDVLTVVWSSNISGVLMTRTSDEKLKFATRLLEPGNHKITVSVSDGAFEREAWISITVQKVPPTVTNGDGGGEGLSLLVGMAALFTVVFVGGLVFFLLMGKRGITRRGREDRVIDAAPEGWEPAEPKKAPPFRLKSIDEVRKKAGYQHPPGPPKVELPPKPPPPETPEVTPEEKEQMKEYKEYRDVLSSLFQMPRGMPHTLTGWDYEKLAKAIIEGDKWLTEDGTPLVRIKNRWYIADRTNVGNFLQEWKPREKSVAEMTKAERAGRLEMLETALLEGRISEETYEHLVKKYEEGE
jgi:hypothetical protein